MRKSWKFSLRACVAGLLVPVFFLTGLGHSDFVFAAATAVAQNAVLSSLKDLTLSEYLGHIEDIFEPSGASPKIILIQDAHAVPDAQRSIRHLLLYFQKNTAYARLPLKARRRNLTRKCSRVFPTNACSPKFCGATWTGGNSPAAWRRL